MLVPRGRGNIYLLLILELGSTCGCVTPRSRVTPEKKTPVPIGQEAGWAPEPVWTQRLEEKSFASSGDRTPVVQSVVIILTELTPAPDNDEKSF
jgi:hypothetical protein